MTGDVVIVVPGILGSDLVDNETGKRIWGFPPKLLIKALVSDNALQPLQLTDAERDGDYRRVTATGFLSCPTLLARLFGSEDYRTLLRAAGQVADPDAVHPFPYDWRLPVAHNGARLAVSAQRRLAAQRARQVSRAGRRPARLVFVAHSMGGLVVQAALAHAPDLADDTRVVITLGTPFYGAVKAAAVLNGNRSGADRLGIWDRVAALAATLPGVHDLLPVYRCVDRGASVERLSPSYVADLGGDQELAEQSLGFQERMLRDRPLAAVRHRPIVGIAQPTMQSMRLADGVVHGQNFCFEADDGSAGAVGLQVRPMPVDRDGDGTVYRESGFLPRAEASYRSVQHGAMQANNDVLDQVRAILDERCTGPLMGEGEIGLDVPDAVPVGGGWLLRVTGVGTPSGVGCAIQDAETGRRVQTPRLENGGGGVLARIALPAPGLYRVQVKARGISPVSQLVAVVGPADTGGKA